MFDFIILFGLVGVVFIIVLALVFDAIRYPKCEHNYEEVARRRNYTKIEVIYTCTKCCKTKKIKF